MFFKILTILLFFLNFVLPNDFYLTQPILIEHSFKNDCSPYINLLKMELNEEKLEIIIEIDSNIAHYGVFVIQDMHFYVESNPPEIHYAENSSKYNGISKITIIEYEDDNEYHNGIKIYLGNKELLTKISPIFDKQINFEQKEYNGQNLQMNGIYTELLFFDENYPYTLEKLNCSFNLNKIKYKNVNKGKEIIKEVNEEEIDNFSLEICLSFSEFGNYLIKLVDRSEFNKGLQYFIKIDENDLKKEGLVKKCVFQTFLSDKNKEKKLIKQLEQREIGENVNVLFEGVKEIKEGKFKGFHSIKKITEEEKVFFKKIIKGLAIYVEETNIEIENEGIGKIVDFDFDYRVLVQILPLFNDIFKYKVKNIKGKGKEVKNEKKKKSFH